MIKTKDKICLVIMLLGFLIITSLCFVGCKSADPFCYFVSEDEIVLMKGTNLSSKNIKIESNVQYNIEWDKNIIDYNSETGDVVAKNEGKTKVTISYVKDNKKYSRSITVAVLTPHFATDIELEDEYVFFVGEPERIDCNVVTQGGEYNLDLFCESSNPLCFQTSKNTIVPQKTGEGILTVKAVSGYDQIENKFSYVSKASKVVILEKVKNLNIELCDKNKQPLNKQETYDLFLNENSVAPDYYLKLTSNQDISHYNISKANDNQKWNVFSNLDYQIERTANTILVPIKVFGSGESFISIILQRQGGESVFVSGSINIKTHTYLSENNISLYVTKENKTKSELNGEIDSSFARMTQNSSTGKFELHKINSDSNYFDLAIQDKKYFYGIICFDNFDANCYNEISAEPSNLKLERLSADRFYFEATESGDASVFLSATAIDGKVFEKTILFSVEKVVAESYQKETNTNIVLSVDEEKDFMISNISPAYASSDVSVCLQNNSGVLSLTGTKVTAKNAGTATVCLSVDGAEFFYNITVIEEDEISFNLVSQTHNEYYIVEFDVESEINIKGAYVEGNDNITPIIMQKRIRIESETLFTTINIVFNKNGEDIIRQFVVNWDNT